MRATRPFRHLTGGIYCRLAERAGSCDPRAAVSAGRRTGGAAYRAGPGANFANDSSLRVAALYPSAASSANAGSCAGRLLFLWE